jgi:hypothetical protein
MGDKKMGAPRKELNFEEVDKLCALQCTEAEIAGYFGISRVTFLERVKEQIDENGKPYQDFEHYFAVKSADGKVSLRRMQWEAAKRGNVTMQIFLGKNMVNQTEKQQIDMAGETRIRVSLVDDE